MIIDVKDLMRMSEFSNMDETVLQRKLDAVEELVRVYTNNNFQNRKVRFLAPSENGKVVGWSEYLKKGDTIEINNSINDGLYVVQKMNRVGHTIELDKELYSAPDNLITKVEYPASVIDGVINLLQWDVQNRSKVGIQSETLSRHSVTYFAQDASNQLMGYPVTLLGFLKPYIKARF